MQTQLILICGVVALAAACGDKKDSPPPSPAAAATSCTSYVDDVKPLIAKSCAASGCHGTSKPKGPELATYKDAKKYGARMIAVLGSRDHHGKTFSTAQGKVVKAWKDDGYPEDECP